tara:strand:- start:1212 stop:1490 length:279 start_codon:yes stop_codon:yes gene_type:complete
MTNSSIQIGVEVVRSKGDYVVGRIGKVIAIDTEKNRAQVDWNNNPKSWVSFSALELTSIPYEIIPPYKKDKFTWTNPKYNRLTQQQHETNEL